ncbi:MAG: succinate dehydrogenase/fumarate reductase iron-sulfur subunit [Armatimonadetes bacterium]|nr:succinate dehydrogenase/fumarate reductase iron-sulfur subunit [Armatimonadota bacterium]MDE2205149.1 succinate dehydrogenase/fumarate reductase iron-sulfur subunit [Armatimonadota bacterium]
MESITLHVFRGAHGVGSLTDYEVPVTPGMVVLDAIHYIQAHTDGTLACRWNCKAAKCGSCSAEINGVPGLLCKTRVDLFPEGDIAVGPMRTFPHVRDLVTDVSWNYRVNARIPPLRPDPARGGAPFDLQQEDVERVQEFRKCIECFLCQDVCHVLREHQRTDAFFGPRQMCRIAGLEMHPMDTLDRRQQLHNEAGVAYCNITKCCTEVCPEHIHITDNAIIPMKERVVDSYFDPVAGILRKIGVLQRQPRQKAAGDAAPATTIHSPPKSAD